MHAPNNNNMRPMPFADVTHERHSLANTHMGYQQQQQQQQQQNAFGGGPMKRHNNNNNNNNNGMMMNGYNSHHQQHAGSNYHHHQQQRNNNSPLHQQQPQHQQSPVVMNAASVMRQQQELEAKTLALQQQQGGNINSASSTSPPTDRVLLPDFNAAANGNGSIASQSPGVSPTNVVRTPKRKTHDPYAWGRSLSSGDLGQQEGLGSTDQLSSAGPASRDLSPVNIHVTMDPAIAASSSSSNHHHHHHQPHLFPSQPNGQQQQVQYHNHHPHHSRSQQQLPSFETAQMNMFDNSANNNNLSSRQSSFTSLPPPPASSSPTTNNNGGGSSASPSPVPSSNVSPSPQLPRPNSKAARRAAAAERAAASRGAVHQHQQEDDNVQQQQQQRNSPVLLEGDALTARDASDSPTDQQQQQSSSSRSPTSPTNGGSNNFARNSNRDNLDKIDEEVVALLEEAKKAPVLNKVLVRFPYRVSIFTTHFAVQPADVVIVEGDRGRHIGVVDTVHPADANVQVRLPPGPRHRGGTFLLRHANAAEVAEYKAMLLEEPGIVERARRQVAVRRLAMNIVHAEFQFDRKVLLLFFHAENRVDFNVLNKDLFRIFNCRIFFQVAVSHENQQAQVITSPPAPASASNKKETA